MVGQGRRAFLFGLGFTIQLTRASESGANLRSVYLRRIGILFAMGVAHALLVWNGDVLHMYALLGLVLLAIRRVSDRTVFALVLAALLLPGARSAYSAITQEPWPFPRESMPARYEEENRIYRSGTYAEQVEFRSRQMTEVYGLTTQIFTFQVIYSRWWMARFRFGPLEWLWRRATYGHFPALRSARADTPAVLRA
jgi:uncharacterized membrane protein YeiB